MSPGSESRGWLGRRSLPYRSPGSSAAGGRRTGLGVGIDYSLFIVNKYREQLKAQQASLEAQQAALEAQKGPLTAQQQQLLAA